MATKVPTVNEKCTSTQRPVNRILGLSHKPRPGCVNPSSYMGIDCVIRCSMLWRVLGVSIMKPVCTDPKTEKRLFLSDSLTCQISSQHLDALDSNYFIHIGRPLLLASVAFGTLGESIYARKDRLSIFSSDYTWIVLSVPHVQLYQPRCPSAHPHYRSRWYFLPYSRYYLVRTP